MVSQTGEYTDDLNFNFIPPFCQYILDNHLAQYAAIQLAIARELKAPVLHQLAHLPEAELLNFSIKTSRKFLEALALNKAGKELDTVMQAWKTNQLKHINKDKVETEDLFLVSHMRKQAFMKMLKYYSQDPQLMFDIIGELDRFFLVQELKATTTYFQLLKRRVEEESYFKERLTITSPGFYYLFDIEHDKQLQTADKLFDYLGYSKEEYQLNNRFFRTLIHAEDLVTAEGYIEKLRLAKDGEVHFFEYRLRDKSGHYRWMRNYEGVYYRNEAGVAIQSIGVAFDITKEHFITEELVRREEELLEAQELANIGSYVWNIETNHTYTTPQALKIMGLAENWTVQDLLQQVHESDRAAVQLAWQNALSGQTDFDIEYRCTVNSKEKIIWGRGKTILVNNTPVRVQGTVMDVTDRHHMIRKLQRSEELYRQAQSMNKLGNWSWTLSGDTMTWSDELFRIHGIEPQSEIITFEKFISFVHPDDREARIQNLQGRLKNPSVQDYFFRITSADGLEKVLYGQHQALLRENGTPYKMIGTCQDVTKQKELETSLYQKTIQLERSNTSLEEFAYITSHDLKEPLRKISLFGDRLLTLGENELVQDHKDTVRKIVRSAILMQHMVDDILSLSAISFNQSFKVVSLSMLLNEVLQNLDYKIEASNARIIFDDLPRANVNETQFRQLFQNLISNAIKFRKQDEDLEIRISHTYLTKEEVSEYLLTPLKKYLQINFRDNGIGFENEFAEKIFIIFQRLHNKSEFEGTGIGLAICKKIIELHHGIIFAEGEPGKGAAFTMIIPVDE